MYNFIYMEHQNPVGPGGVGCGSAGDGVSVRSRRYWPAGREWNKTLLEEGFCILGARSPFFNHEISGAIFRSDLFQLQ